jgi:CHAT domain-containing protein
VTVAPSAMSWLIADRARRRSARPASAPRRVVLIAGPGLPEAPAEVASIAALYPGARVLSGPGATVAATLRALDGADVAHFAAHGRFRDDNPMFSSLVLADGALTVHDLEGLRRAPATIMLAACDSARSPTQAGDEMTGLATGLLAVGARCVVAPLLPMPDAVSSRLARGWHERLREGHGPAAALAGVPAGSATAAPAGEPLARLAASALVCLGHGW